MQKQTAHQEIKKVYSSDTQIKIKAGGLPKSLNERERPTKASTPYLKNCFYEKKVHSLDGPGGSYDGL
jgi:hypothetical protein